MRFALVLPHDFTPPGPLFALDVVFSAQNTPVPAFFPFDPFASRLCIFEYHYTRSRALSFYHRLSLLFLSVNLVFVFSFI